jgi:2-dehydropantoate 2-reductase
MRGQLTEIDYLNGAVVAAGAAVGVPTPVNARFVELVHEVERTREFVDLAAVYE